VITSVGFSASRELSAEARNGVVTNVLTARVPDADRYITGACIGGDAFIGKWLCYHRDTAEHVIVVPADRSRVDPWWGAVPTGLRRITVIEMPPGTTYADRNRRIVDESTMVFGFPAYSEEDPQSLRSGTWQTLRFAKRVGKLREWHCVTPPYQGMIESAALL